jgi:hypothetical protein
VVWHVQLRAVAAAVTRRRFRRVGAVLLLVAGALALVVWAQDWRPESFESLTTRVLRERFEALAIPEEIQVNNYVSMSLSGDISDFGWDKYLLMRADGPNDGLSLLPDLLFPDGRTIVSPKGDHFFAEDPLIDEKSVALVMTILETIDQ